jgi:hypothetical protein
VERLEDTADMRRGDDVAAGEELLKAAQALEVGIHHLGEEARGEVEGGDAVAQEDLLQLQHVTRRVRREEGEASAIEEAAPDFEGGSVEGDGSNEQEGVLWPQVSVGDAAHGAQDGGVLDADALGLASGAGGEVNVDEVVGRGAAAGSRGGLGSEVRLLQQQGGQALGGQRSQ